jgi:flagellar export protein FliJ
MSKAQQKIKKLSSVIKIRERELNYSKNELIQTQRDKHEMMGSLNKSQQSYMHSVDSLNKLRTMQASSAETLAIESSIEFVRNKWANQLSEVRRLERQERLQMALVQDLEAKLKAVEKISDKYEDELKVERAKLEQANLDEFVIARYGK